MVVFNNLTGNTHLLNPLAGLVLQYFAESSGAINLQELIQSIRDTESIEPDVSLIDAVENMLQELQRFGLIEPDST